jgi:hypothetical protein
VAIAVSTQVKELSVVELGPDPTVVESDEGHVMATIGTVCQVRGPDLTRGRVQGQPLIQIVIRNHLFVLPDLGMTPQVQQAVVAEAGVVAAVPVTGDRGVQLPSRLETLGRDGEAGVLG